jgi:transposase-like protein
LIESLCAITSIGRIAMQCPRCKGRMFAEKFYDFVRSFDAWKCTCCGEVLDSTILANRARSNNTHLG